MNSEYVGDIFLPRVLKISFKIVMNNHRSSPILFMELVAIPGLFVDILVNNRKM